MEFHCKYNNKHICDTATYLQSQEVLVLLLAHGVLVDRVDQLVQVVRVDFLVVHGVPLVLKLQEDQLVLVVLQVLLDQLDHEDHVVQSHHNLQENLIKEKLIHGNHALTHKHTHTHTYIYIYIY